MQTTIGTQAPRGGTFATALVAVSFVLGATGCAGSAGSVASEDVGQAIQPVIKGTASGADQDAVVVLTTFVNGQRAFLCSATLVAPNLVLTARHCVSDVQGSAGCGADGVAVQGGAIDDDRDPATLGVFVGRGGIAPDSTDLAKADAKGASLVVETSGNVCNHDLAFIVLDRAIDAPTASLRMTPLAATETISAIGWGVDATGNLPVSRGIRSDLAIAGIGPGLYPDNPKFGYGDSELVIGESVCAGDSGGPALSATGSVVGVAARAGNGLPVGQSYATTCTGPTAHAVYSQLSSHEALVTRAFAAAGATPKLEAAPATTTAASATTATTTEPAPPATTTAATVTTTDDAPTAAAGGCSMTSEPQSGSVEYAAGLVALLASLFGLRRRSKPEHEVDLRARSRDRLPSMP